MVVALDRLRLRSYGKTICARRAIRHECVLSSQKDWYVIRTSYEHVENVPAKTGLKWHFGTNTLLQFAYTFLRCFFCSDSREAPLAKHLSGTSEITKQLSKSRSINPEHFLPR